MERKQIKETISYMVPEIGITEISVENGFAQSGGDNPYSFDSIDAPDYQQGVTDF